MSMGGLGRSMYASRNERMVARKDACQACVSKTLMEAAAYGRLIMQSGLGRPAAIRAAATRQALVTARRSSSLSPAWRILGINR